MVFRNWLFLGVLLFNLGCFAQAYYHICPSIAPPILPESSHGEIISAKAEVTSFPRVFDDYQSFFAKITTGDYEGRTFTVYASPQTQIQLGQHLALELKLFRPRGFRNPGQAYRPWVMAARGIYGTAQALSVTHLKDGRGVSGFRVLIQQQIQSSTTGTGRALILALVLGDRSHITAPMRASLASFGLSHVLAVSGMHIGIIAGLGFLLGRLTWHLIARRWIQDQLSWSLWAALILAFAYGMLAGMALSTQRSLLALVLMLWQRWRSGQSHWADNYGWTLLIVTLFSPLAGMTLDFWCSFGALALLILLFDRRKGDKGTWDWLSAQCCLSLGLLPLSSMMYDSISVLSPFVNLLIVAMLSGIIMPGLFLMLILSPVIPSGLGFFAHGLGLGLSGLEQLATLPWAGVVELSATGGQLLGIALTTLFAVHAAFRPYAKWMCLCAALLWLPWQRLPFGVFEVFVFDVGQGTSVHIRTRHHRLLYDAGPEWFSGLNAGDQILIPWFRKQRLNELHVMVLSHADRDHQGGANAVLASQRVHHVYASDAGDLDASSQTCDRQGWWWDGVLFRFLSAQSQGLNKNERSCLLLVSDGQTSLLLPGDIGSDTEQLLIAQRPEQLKATVLLAPHHGSRTSSSTGFIHHVAPQLVIVTAQDGHHFGHPHAEIMERYRIRGISLLHIGQSGAWNWRSDQLE